MIDSTSDCILDSDMANLLQMTNDLLLKIKQQLMEKTLWTYNKQIPWWMMKDML